MAKSRDSIRKLFLDMGFYDILTFAKLFVHHYRRVGWRSHCNIFQKGLKKNSFHLRAASNRPLRAMGQNSSAHMTRGVAAIWPLLLFTFVYWTRPALIVHFFYRFYLLILKFLVRFSGHFSTSSCLKPAQNLRNFFFANFFHQTQNSGAKENLKK